MSLVLWLSVSFNETYVKILDSEVSGVGLKLSFTKLVGTFGLLNKEVTELSMFISRGGGGGGTVVMGGAGGGTDSILGTSALFLRNPVPINLG